jgi:hypothetical protein
VAGVVGAAAGMAVAVSTAVAAGITENDLSDCSGGL